jgi:hypothetical protein
MKEHFVQLYCVYEILVDILVVEVANSILQSCGMFAMFYMPCNVINLDISLSCLRTSNCYKL